MTDAFLYAAVRTPFGRFGGALAGVRPDDLAATALTGLLDRAPDLDPAEIGDVVLGHANGAGEDNRNVGRMAVLLAGLPVVGAGRDGQPAVRLAASRRAMNALAADRDRRRRRRAWPAAWSR